MTTEELDGRIGEGWSGTPRTAATSTSSSRARQPDLRGRRLDALQPVAGPHAGARLRWRDPPEYEPVWPPTLMMNKATATDDRHQTITWGAAQLGIAQGVLDAVADGLLEATGDLFVLVAVWVDPGASDETAVRLANREAVRKASASASRAATRPRRRRSSSGGTRSTSPFYGGR